MVPSERRLLAWLAGTMQKQSHAEAAKGAKERAETARSTLNLPAPKGDLFL